MFEPVTIEFAAELPIGILSDLRCMDERQLIAILQHTTLLLQQLRQA
jgi:hypothetical protein